MTAKRTGNGAILIAGALLWAGMAEAQALPAHSVSFDPVTAVCRIVLEPSGTTGANPARLFLSSDMLKPLLSFGLDGSSIAEAVLVRQGERHPFIGRRGLSPNELRADPIWSLLDSGSDGKDSLYLTVKGDDGGYSSARYDGLKQDDILRLAALACGVEGLDPPALTPVEHRAAEDRLSLSDADRLHIRRVLAAHYAAAGTDVGDGGSFTVTDRRYIAQYNTEKGYPSGEYLWPAAVPALLKEEVATPTPAAAGGAPGEAELSRSGDWVVLANADKTSCRVSSAATAADGLDGGERMEFAVDRSGRGGMMAIELVTPNPFSADMPLGMVIDGQGFALQVEAKSGAVIPQPQPDGSMTPDLTRALRVGKVVTVEGVSAKSGAPARLTFSAMGFSAAFKAMSDACNRPGVMGWIE